MKIGSDRARETVANLMTKGLECDKCDDAGKELMKKWLDAREDAAVTREVADKLVPMLEKCKCEICKKLYEYRHFIPSRSQWIFGGDGWAYDIGYGGLDHVLASGLNVNVLVLDTEVYSNTGGQSSKSTPAGAIAKFAAAGKRIRKKDLGMMAISYGYVYVAQVAMGASPAQYLNAIKEAEAYDGPSLIIAYSPCINHGLKAGMGLSQKEEKLAVECGYWHLYRYNPTLEGTDKNPFSLDSKEPDWTKFQDFLKGEVRFASLYKLFPDNAAELLGKTEEFAKCATATTPGLRENSLQLNMLISGPGLGRDRILCRRPARTGISAIRVWTGEETPRRHCCSQRDIRHKYLYDFLEIIIEFH